MNTKKIYRFGGLTVAFLGLLLMPLPVQAAGAAPQAFLEQLSGVYESYFELQKALGRDDVLDAKSALHTMKEKLDSVNMNLLQGKLHEEWMNLNERLQSSIVLGIDAKTLEGLRTNSFADIASQMVMLEQTFGHGEPVPYYEAFCPMALNNKGASWLQTGSIIMNPFLGKSMQTCGEIKNHFAARSGMEQSHRMGSNMMRGHSGQGHAH